MWLIGELMVHKTGSEKLNPNLSAEVDRQSHGIHKSPKNWLSEIESDMRKVDRRLAENERELEKSERAQEKRELEAYKRDLERMKQEELDRQEEERMWAEERELSEQHWKEQDEKAEECPPCEAPQEPLLPKIESGITKAGKLVGGGVGKVVTLGESLAKRKKPKNVLREMGIEVM